MSMSTGSKRSAIDVDSQEEELKRDQSRATKASRVEDDDSHRTTPAILPFVANLGGTGPNKVVASSSAAVAQAAKPSIHDAAFWDDDDDDDDRSISELALIHPMTPTKDPFAADLGETGQLQVIIYMCAKEESTSKFTAGIQKCAANCSTEIHKFCFQQDGTRHISMWAGNLTLAQARGLKFRQDPKLPIDIELTGWIDWKGGNYLEVGKETTLALRKMLNDLEGLPKSEKKSCDHLSLYRKRGNYSEVVNHQFGKVRKALADHDWGSLEGVSVRIKVLGSPYNKCRVLAGV
jgi:hypothetical protein